ncbi:MAG: PQQ-binding-like beta-propeller repeat protein [Verrucomicrobiae bacterium]|nr:PQQ-binding-like beta-propeller repeat protein [Verrucomicrobiae bacterium]
MATHPGTPGRNAPSSFRKLRIGGRPDLNQLGAMKRCSGLWTAIGLALSGILPLRALDSVPSLPEAATSFGATVLGEFLYVYGGHTGERHVYTADKVSGAFHRVALAPGATWEVLPSGPAAQGTALVAVDGHLVRVGGMAARNLAGEPSNLQSLDSVARYDPKTGDWSELPPLPAARSSHDVAVIGRSLYAGGGWRLAGGANAGVFHTNIAVLNLADDAPAWRLLPQPFARRGLALAALGGRLYFIGGMTGDGATTLAVDIFDTRTGGWSRGPDLPSGKLKGFGNSAVTAGDRIYVSGLSGEVHALTTDSSEWERVAQLRQRRFFHRLVAANDQTLLALGGEDEEGKIATVEVIRIGGPGADGAAAVAPAASRITGWNQWRGPDRDGHSTETGWNKDWSGAGPRPLWRTRVGTGMSAPVIVDGCVLLCGNDGRDTDQVMCLDVLSGESLWTFESSGPSKVHEMAIVPPGPAATPTVIGDRVHHLTREGVLQVLDLATGKLLWSRDLPGELGGRRPVYGYTQSPLVDGGRIFLDIGAPPGAPGSTVALDAATGDLRWRSGVGEAGYSSARAFSRDGARWVAMFKGEGLQVYDPSDGRVAASHDLTSRDFCNALTPVFVGDRILVSNTGGTPAALLEWGADGLKPAWTQPAFAMLFNNAILHEGCLFGFDEQRRGANAFVCLDAASGAVRWESDAVEVGVFLWADNHWLFFTRRGEVVLAPASRDSLEPMARFQAVGGKCYATPAFAGGVLVVRNNEGDAVAYDLRSPTTGSPGR